MAKRIAKSEAEDLLSSTYLIIFDKKNFELPNENDQAIHYFTACLNNNFKLYNSSFNRQKRGDIVFDSSFFETLQNEEESIVSQKTIVEFKDTLPDHERLLFELHYEDDLSLRSISEEFKSIGIDEHVIRRINTPLKEKIKTKWKQ